MEDVLGGLCTGIANSIRGGLGDIGKIAPTAFPDKIDEIVNMLKNAGGGGGSPGGSGGGGSAGDLKFATGIFRADANRSRATVTHGMDTMPDFILVQIAGMYLGDINEYLEELPLEAAWGFKSTFSSDYLSSVVIPGISFPATTYGIDNVSASDRSVGYIYCPDEKTFEVGAVDAAKGMLTNKNGISYRWIAISGLGADEPVLQDKTITENGTYTADEGFDGLGEVTVEVAGSGGSLPAGVYWGIDTPLPNNYQNMQFVFNGELFLMQSTYNSGSAYDFYKHSNGAYTKILTEADCSPGYAITYHGKAHILGNQYNYHYVFDGNAVTKLNNLPTYNVYNSIFIWNDKLMASATDGKIYEWNEAEDSWANTANTGLSSALRQRCIVHNDSLYLLGGAQYATVVALYIWKDGAFVKVKDVNCGERFYEGVYLKGCMYYFDNSSYGGIVSKYDIDNDTYTVLGNNIYLGSSRACVYNGEIHITSPSRQHVVMHEVTE